MKKIISVIVCSFMFCVGAWAQSKTNIIDKTGIELKLFNAHEAYLGGDYAGALKLYKEANTAEPDNASIEYHVGQCYLMLSDIPKAINFLEKAENADPNAGDDLHLNLGQAYQQADMLSKALKEFQMYKQKFADNTKQLTQSEVDYYVAQCNTAVKLEAHPVKVTITNMGVPINSMYDDKGPILTDDGRTLIFTSRRPFMSSSSKSKKKDKGEESEETVQSFDNVYSSQWDTAAGKWSLSYPILGDINEPYTYTAATCVSVDGDLMLLYKNNNSNAVGGDIFIAKKTHSGNWGDPQSLGHPVNTSYYEDGACFSPDGSTMYFMSEKPGGFGQGDIYRADKIGRGEWGEPVNLGPAINTPYDDGAPYIGPDGKTLFFSSEGHNSMGGYDIFKASMSDSGKWGNAVNLGYPINTVDNDMGFTMTLDAKTGYFASNRKGGMGGRDIYKVDLSQYTVLASDSGSNKPRGISVLRGKVINAKGKAIEGARVTIIDSADTKVGNLRTDKEGNYYITLKGNADYKVKADAKDCKAVTMKIHLPTALTGTYSMQQDFQLEKK